MLNAANEVAVAAFLEGAIRFDQIHPVNAQTLEDLPARLGALPSVDDLIALDAQARGVAQRIVRRMGSS